MIYRAIIAFSSFDMWFDFKDVTEALNFLTTGINKNVPNDQKDEKYRQPTFRLEIIKNV